MGASCECAAKGEKIVIQNLPMVIGACTDVTMGPDKDSKGLLNQRLLAASRDNDIGALREVLESGAFVETRRPFVMRPKPPTTVGALLDGPGRKRKAPREGLTPLMYASQNGSVPGVQLLLQAKAQVMALDEDRLTPLHFAASSGVLEVCRLLLSHGAEAFALEDSGKRALDYVPEECLVMRADKAKWEELLGGSAPRTAPPEPKLLGDDLADDAGAAALAAMMPHLAAAKMNAHAAPAAGA
mmetsp:Transcript_131593/g.420978  ORF Transcript_131593/g.420978 Transcript_131593/m.420978 type:complete len:242 (-) Transcript_131593:387-1112(-)|eukprot:CAMPEP_0203873438 /NCGR_PEP_ID=MMETSP0359-20131031/19749_1 /ASSEMBLY_ACC=CAM_ASM_000338 /TAXON_ID=268821 /ORGANISM="Scrippsiella Hangoei, Strain SHTV-5" /LENGTH=241 /DNA_ID=CAMNT_0050792135 /DNA_START=125 /DNA_END=850 /DNA_ORIENTATION=+